MKKVILLCLLLIPLLSISQKGKFKITSIPEWIIKKNLDQESLNGDGDQNGYYYQLLDFQTNLKAKGYFSHYSIKINNAKVYNKCRI